MFYSRLSLPRNHGTKSSNATREHHETCDEVWHRVILLECTLCPDNFQVQCQEADHLEDTRDWFCPIHFKLGIVKEDNRCEGDGEDPHIVAGRLGALEEELVSNQKFQSKANGNQNRVM